MRRAREAAIPAAPRGAPGPLFTVSMDTSGTRLSLRYQNGEVAVFQLLPEDAPVTGMLFRHNGRWWRQM